MPDIDDLLRLAGEGDEDALSEIRERFTQAEREKTVAARDLKIKTDTTLKERYPRALKVLDMGRLSLTDDMDYDAVVAALKEQEEFLAEMGVPVSPATGQATQEVTPDAAPQGDDMTPVVTPEDPAQALTGGRGGGSPGGQPRDLVAEWVDAMKGSTQADRNRAYSTLVEINQIGMENPERAQAMMDAITESVSAQHPVGY